MSNLEQKIIKLLADYPEREFYGQEISKKLKFSKASASNILKSLSVKKIILKKTKGHMNFYQINSQNLELKRFRVNSILKQFSSLLPQLSGISQKIILFGSASRGEQTINSDIDLFILTNKKDEARKTLKKISNRLPIKSILKTSSEWSEMEVKDPEFYQEIKNGIILYNYVPRI